MALRLSLRPSERVIIGGAVITNGNARAEITVENDVPVLRRGDILSPSVVATPCERIYLALELAYVEPERRTGHLTAYHDLARELLQAAPSCVANLDEIDARLAAERPYYALKEAQTLLEHERDLLSHVR